MAKLDKYSYFRNSSRIRPIDPYNRLESEHGSE